MAKQNWLNKQLDQASTTVRSWSDWKRETIKSQISKSGGSTTSHNDGTQQEKGGEVSKDRK